MCLHANVVSTDILSAFQIEHVLAVDLYRTSIKVIRELQIEMLFGDKCQIQEYAYMH